MRFINNLESIKQLSYLNFQWRILGESLQACSLATKKGGLTPPPYDLLVIALFSVLMLFSITLYKIFYLETEENNNHHTNYHTDY
jgi:hypothetical protein